MKLTAKDKKYIVDAFKKYISVCGNQLTCEECPYHTANQAFDKTLGTNNFRICQSIFLLETMKADTKTKPVKSKYNVGDTVYYAHEFSNTSYKTTVKKVFKNKCSYSYFLNDIKYTKYDYLRISENRIFRTYEEAANAVYRKTETIEYKEI